jgi:subtilisin family serine protease
MNPSILRLTRLRPCKIAGFVACISWAIFQTVVFAGPQAAVSDQILVRSKSHLSAKAAKSLFAVHGATELDAIDQLDVRVLKVPAGQRDRVLEALKRNPNIEFAEIDPIASPGGLTNDPYVLSGQEWHVAKIQADRAWDVTSATLSTVIAIVDTGVAPNQPDLAGKILPGYNFYANTTNTADDVGHGTAVAGAAAAQGNNGQGVAGVAWGASILPVKISDPTGYATYSNMAKALTYAVDHGARVINISFYGSTPSSTLQNAVDYVWAHNGIIFACAGNTGTNFPQYPAACPRVVAVSSTTSSDMIASYSTFGSFVSLAAPGSGIFTTNRDGTYASWSGTSFASPIAAGVAALVVAANPQLSNAAIVDLLKNSAEDLGAAGFDPYFGYGRVNAYRAVVAAAIPPVDRTAPVIAITSPLSGSTVAGTVTVQANASDAVGVTKVELSLDGVLTVASTQAAAAFTWDTLAFPNGTHTLSALAYDAAGNVGSAAPISVNVQNSVVVIKDTVAPNAVILSPAAGTLVGRSLRVSTQTTDNVGVVRVELYRNGFFTASSTTPSAVFSLNTTKWVNGPHLLQVIAYDAAGNAGVSAVVTVTK